MIYVVGPRDKNIPDAHLINVTSQRHSPFSPMMTGCVNPISSPKMENAWQFSKVYPEHADANGNPRARWYIWRGWGLMSTWAYRYPMSKGAVPLYSYLDGRKLNYIEARKELYVPLYKSLLGLVNPSLEKLVELCKNKDVALWDFDGYHTDDNFDTILNNPDKKMGHAFVLREVINERLQSSW